MAFSLTGVIEKYTRDFAGLPYSSIASIILENEPAVKVAHRTLRRRISLTSVDVQDVKRYDVVYLETTDRHLFFDRKLHSTVYLSPADLDVVKMELRYNPNDSKYLLKRFDLELDELDLVKKCLFFSSELGEYDPVILNAGPRILVLDIETAPILGWVWKIWKEDVGKNRIASEWFCLSWAAKWLFETTLMGDVLSPGEVKMQDDSRIMSSLWELVDQADIIIAHNGRRFDMPRINTRFIINGIKPPSPYQLIDTLDALRKNFSFTSNSLDNVNNSLGLSRKIETDWSLWENCMKQDPDSLNLMLEYNKQDIIALEELYLTLRPWIKSHPNLGLYLKDNVSVCPACGSPDITFDGNFYFTSVNKYSTYRCNKCTHVGRSRGTAISTVKNKSVLTTTAR